MQRLAKLGLALVLLCMLGVPMAFATEEINITPKMIAGAIDHRSVQDEQINHRSTLLAENSPEHPRQWPGP